MLLRSFVLDKAHLYAMISGALGRVCYQPDTTKYEDFEGLLCQKASGKYGFSKRCQTTGIKSAIQNTLVQ